MTILKADTIQQLQQLLTKFDKNLPVAVFDCDRGYMSVAFKKEEKIENDKKFQWLTFYAHETIQMYDINTLLGYLSKLPSQAPIAKKTENDEYTSLYLSIDSMRDNGKFYQWLVLSDELEYDRFFRQHDTKTEGNHTERALEKMLSEIKQESSQPIERIHQWLCKQTNQELFKGILTEGKTLKGAYAYCTSRAKEMAKSGSSFMVEDETVFQWVSDYFILYELPKAKTK
ncbi:MAG: PcfK-like family protein, partial [Vagococcus sp.]|nr:PcfK-like family protein [Vagococcus sp.]